MGDDAGNDAQQACEQGEVAGHDVEVMKQKKECTDDDQCDSYVGFKWFHDRPLSDIILGGDKLVALSVDIDDFYLFVVLQVLAQLGDIDIHGAGIEVVVVNPDGLQGEVTLQDLVGMRAEQGE